ncbi:IclR family transcriptional regulator [Paracoccus sp. Z330]|uniref:IclR family transcriptional regulator n=1 Tax=Paracoccus onchidii TaxID=3017813 RepID=A0ABT4ZIT4_9RHOB|nr:IclR family transcriptional regulator [Paracoccus onchidii]MDB6179276.1 IclR family transcriptional regulator [Paracoccus onchidii]
MAAQTEDATQGPRKKASVPAVEKALDILEVLSSHRDGLTMNELVEALERSMGEIYRVVLYLVERDYLQQDPDTSRYSLTPRLFELAHRNPVTERMLNKAVPVLERIAAITEQSCHLGVLNRANILILASVASPRPAGYAVRTGAMFPALMTSTGMVVVAHSDPEAQNRFAGRAPADARDAIRKRLQDISLHGYDDSESQIVKGVRNLSAPVFDNRGVVGAITCGHIDQSNMKTTAAETLEIIRENARQLSRALGWLGD